MTQTNPTTAAASKPELFENHLVKDGKVQKTWADAVLFRNVDSIQTAYDQKKAPKEDGFSWKTPFTWGYNIIATVVNAIVDAFKAVFGLCFDYSEAAAEDAGKADPKKTEKV